MIKTSKILISGRVQRVFFRDFIKKSADSLGLAGYTRNLEDGRVEVVVEGQHDKINEMIKICRKGAPHSEVRELEIEELKNQGFNEFKIIHF